MIVLAICLLEVSIRTRASDLVFWRRACQAERGTLVNGLAPIHGRVQEMIHDRLRLTIAQRGYVDSMCLHPESPLIDTQDSTKAADW